MFAFMWVHTKGKPNNMQTMFVTIMSFVQKENLTICIRCLWHELAWFNVRVLRVPKLSISFPCMHRTNHFVAALTEMAHSLKVTVMHTMLLTGMNVMQCPVTTGLEAFVISPVHAQNQLRPRCTRKLKNMHTKFINYDFAAQKRLASWKHTNDHCLLQAVEFK